MMMFVSSANVGNKPVVPSPRPEKRGKIFFRAICFYYLKGCANFVRLEKTTPPAYEQRAIIYTTVYDNVGNHAISIGDIRTGRHCHSIVG